MPFPWLAGMRVTAARLNEHTPAYVFKGVDEDRTNSSTTADDPDLQITLAEGLWEIDTLMDFSGTAGSQGLRMNWRTTGTLSLTALRATLGPDAGSTDRLNSNVWIAVHGIGTEARYGNQQGVGLRSNVRERFVLSGEGDLILQWAQITSHADPTHLDSGSYIRAARIG